MNTGKHTTVLDKCRISSGIPYFPHLSKTQGMDTRLRQAGLTNIQNLCLERMKNHKFSFEKKRRYLSHRRQYHRYIQSDNISLMPNVSQTDILINVIMRKHLLFQTKTQNQNECSLTILRFQTVDLQFLHLFFAPDEIAAYNANPGVFHLNLMTSSSISH